MRKITVLRGSGKTLGRFDELSYRGGASYRVP